jgi:preprotein translocase subunit SecE
MDKLKLIFERVKQFLKDSKTELRKVTWPTSKQTLASTSVVIIVVVIISVFLGVVDFGLSKIIRMALG